MASSPLPLTDGSQLTKQDKLAIALAERLMDGETPISLAQKLAQGDKKKAKYWRRRIRTLTSSNKHAQAVLAAETQMEMWAGLAPATRALVARAKRGRPDAVKMVWAATGFYNDRVKHEHSGAIEINVSIPRPRPTEDNVRGPGKIEEGFVDADVVEEE